MAAVDVSPLLAALGQLGQVNAMNRALRDRERERRRAERAGGLANLGAVAGAIGGGVLSGGNPQAIALGAGAGSTLGRAFGGGAPVQAAEAIQIGAGIGGLQQQLAQQRQMEQLGAAEQGILASLRPAPEQMALEPGMSGPGDVAAQGQAAGLSQFLEAAGQAPPGSRLSMLGAALQARQALQPPGPPEPLSPEGKLQTDINRGIVSPEAARGKRERAEDQFGVLRYVDNGAPVFPNVTPEETEIFQGTGMPAQESNVLISVGKQARGGWESVPQDRRAAYTLAYNRAQREQILQVPDGQGGVMTIRRPPIDLPPDLFPPPPGTMRQEGGERQPPSAAAGPAQTTQAPQAEAEETVPGLPEGWKVVGTKRTPVPVTDAAKLQMLRGAKESIDTVKSAIIRPDGSIDRGLVATMTMNVPFSEGRQRRQELKDALEARIRVESGSAVPEEEIGRLAERFMPSMLDSDAGIKSKFERIEGFFSGALDLADFGRGILSDETLSAIERNRKKQLDQVNQQFKLAPVN